MTSRFERFIVVAFVLLCAAAIMQCEIRVAVQIDPPTTGDSNG